MKEEKSKLAVFLLKSEETLKEFIINPDKVLKNLGISISIDQKFIKNLVDEIQEEFKRIRGIGSKELAKGYHMDDMSSVDFHRKDYY